MGSVEWLVVHVMQQGAPSCQLPAGWRWAAVPPGQSCHLLGSEWPQALVAVAEPKVG
jgi:hypothetical protein